MCQGCQNHVDALVGAMPCPPEFVDELACLERRYKELEWRDKELEAAKRPCTKAAREVAADPQSQTASDSVRKAEDRHEAILKAIELA